MKPRNPGSSAFDLHGGPLDPVVLKGMLGRADAPRRSGQDRVGEVEPVGARGHFVLGFKVVLGLLRVIVGSRIFRGVFVRGLQGSVHKRS